MPDPSPAPASAQPEEAIAAPHRVRDCGEVEAAALEWTSSSTGNGDAGLRHRRSHTTEELRHPLDAAMLELATAQAGFKYRYNVVEPPELLSKRFTPIDRACS